MLRNKNNTGKALGRVAIFCIAIFAASFVRADDTSDIGEPRADYGLVLPDTNPMPLSTYQNDLLAHPPAFSAVSDSALGAQGQPIPVPLPPGIWSCVIGLVAVMIARSRWKLRQA